MELFLAEWLPTQIIQVVLMKSEDQMQITIKIIIQLGLN